MTEMFGQSGYTDSVTGIWTPYNEEPSNEPGWKARDAEVTSLREQLAAAVVRSPTVPELIPAADTLTLISALWQAIATVRDESPRVPDDADSGDIVDAILPLINVAQARGCTEHLAAFARKWEQSDDPERGRAASWIRDEIAAGLAPSVSPGLPTTAAGIFDAVLIDEARATIWTVLGDLDQPLEVRLADALESANAREETLRAALIPADYEYRLAYLDADLIGAVRGPEDHAISVWNCRRDTANESSYGADIKLQRRPLVGWDDFRVPAAEDIAGTADSATCHSCPNGPHHDPGQRDPGISTPDSPIPATPEGK